MSQQEILKFLEANPNRFFSAKEISDKLKINITAASKSLGKMRKTNWITYKLEVFATNYRNPNERFVYSAVKNVS